MPVSQQFGSVEGKAGPSFIGLVQVHAFVSGHKELGILGGICEGGAAQPTAMCIQLYFGILLDGQCVALREERVKAEEARSENRTPFYWSHKKPQNFSHIGV